MIYISSACVKAPRIKDAIELLHENGFSNIELSGGTKYYDDLESDLLELQNSLSLNLLCHNYFPPSKEPFVLNLASLDAQVAQLSVNHFKNTIDLSKKLGVKKFGLHAGYLINIPINRLGKPIENQSLFDKHKALEAFNSRLHDLINHAGNEVDIYVENNVVSQKNYLNFDNNNPFLFTNSIDLSDLNNTLKFKPLIDVAHLKVSCNTLGLNFEKELSTLLQTTDYIHISDNNGISDQNMKLSRNSELHLLLKKYWKKGKTITLEIYSGIDDVKESYNLIQELNN